MSLKHIQKSLSVAIIASETSHIFCCVLPTVFSVLTLAAGIGLIASVPAGLTTLHEFIHDWEIPMITLSGILLLFGWAIHFLAIKIDCHDTGCAHGPCEPNKNRASKFLAIATILFFANVVIFVSFHYGLEEILH